MKEPLGWVTDLENFKNDMGHKIAANIPEKGFTWREPTHSMELFLLQKLHEYVDAKKWVDVANIAFMFHDRERRVVDEVNGGKE